MSRSLKRALAVIGFVTGLTAGFLLPLSSPVPHHDAQPGKAQAAAARQPRVAQAHFPPAN